MPSATFLAGDYLARADIVLMCGGTLFSRAIRFATRSPFSHAALIFLVPHRETGFERAFLIESVPKGVKLTSLADGFKEHPLGVAILRLERGWFQQDQQAIVRGKMLDFIRAGYDWQTVVSLALSVANGMMFGREHYARSLGNSLRKAYRRRGLAPANFICSGFVQYGFLRAIHDLSSGANPVVPIEDVKFGLFNQRLKDLDVAKVLQDTSLAELLSTTPEDISQAPQLQWKYVYRRGMVHRVSSREEAIAVLEKPSVRKAGLG